MRGCRSVIAFVLVSDLGWPHVASMRNTATQVRDWAENNWAKSGGYERAKEDGWRVRRVRVLDDKEPRL